MATAFEPEETKALPTVTKKVTLGGFYTIEARPFNYGEMVMLQSVVAEFPRNKAWFEKKEVNGKKSIILYTDTSERASFIDFLLNKLELPRAQAEVADLFKLEATEYPLREELHENTVFEITLSKRATSHSCKL